MQKPMEKDHNTEVLQGLEPRLVWEEFRKLCTIPHCSGQEQHVLKYIITTAETLGLSSQQDAVGNVVVSLPAINTKEKTHNVSIALQAHVDMVCQKLADSSHDFLQDPLTLQQEGDWVTAKATTLGADNGIGVAYLLSLMHLYPHSDLNHTSLLLIFTVDEERSLQGAQQFDSSLLTGIQYFINLDSSSGQEICIGSAGDSLLEMAIPIKRIALPFEDQEAFQRLELRLEGLEGGHSGVDMRPSTPNAILLLNELVQNLRKQFPSCYVEEFLHQSPANAIPREAQVTLRIREEHNSAVKLHIQAWEKQKRETAHLQSLRVLSEWKVLHDKQVSTVTVLDEMSCQRLGSYLLHLPYGILEYGEALGENHPPSVAVSVNLSSINTHTSTIQTVHLLRFSSLSQCQSWSDRFLDYAKLFQGKIQQEPPSLPWSPSPQSQLLKKAEAVYQDLFQETAKVVSVHAGLEAGLLLKDLPIQAISIGVDIEKAHTTDERVRTASVKRTWSFLWALLRSLQSC